MPEQKNVDRRVLHSRQTLFEALLALISEKNYNRHSGHGGTELWHRLYQTIIDLYAEMISAKQ